MLYEMTWVTATVALLIVYFTLQWDQFLYMLYEISSVTITIALANCIFYFTNKENSTWRWFTTRAQTCR